MLRNGQDFLVWISGHFYSRESFIQEARRMGICPRVPYVPENVVLGNSRVLLISDMTDADKILHINELRRRGAERYKQLKESGFTAKSTHISGPMPRGVPTIFGYFTIQDIIMVTGLGIERSERHKKLGISEYGYHIGKFGFNGERASGSLQTGGIYLLGESSMQRIENLTHSGDVRGNISVLQKPFPYMDKRFRGIKIISHNMANRLIGEVSR